MTAIVSVGVSSHNAEEGSRESYAEHDLCCLISLHVSQGRTPGLRLLSDKWITFRPQNIQGFRRGQGARLRLQCIAGTVRSRSSLPVTPLKQNLGQCDSEEHILTCTEAHDMPDVGPGRGGGKLLTRADCPNLDLYLA